MGVLLTLIGGLIFLLAGLFMLLMGINGGMPAFLGALPLAGPAFLAGLLLAGFGGMLSCLIEIQKSTARQTELLERLVLRTGPQS